MLRVFTQKPSYMLKTSEIGIQEFAVPPLILLLLNRRFAFIRFNNTFEEVEYTDPNSLPDSTGKFVIIGVTAEGIANPVPIHVATYIPTNTGPHATKFYRWIQTYSEMN